MNKIKTYFKMEIGTLSIVTVSGIIYNIGLTAGPFFEGQLAQRLFDVINGTKTTMDMILLACIYLAVILVVQVMRCLKRFYVRRFANNTSRRMRRVLYNNLVHRSHSELNNETIGDTMTKAITDVDACAEGMRKFTTEVFDTGIALISYLVMMFYYDWRMALIASSFTPFAYLFAEKMKVRVTKANAAYKKSAGTLNNATMDRVKNAITYRINGCDDNQNAIYEKSLADYEKKAVMANVWENSMPPIYNIISMTGVIFIIFLGVKNVNGNGWAAWNIAAFTTFLSCFAKMAIKSSKAAKLFNSVQKAKVSWMRVKPFMKDNIENSEKTDIDYSIPVTLEITDLKSEIFGDISFTAEAGMIIGVGGPVASGKTTFSRVFLSEEEYQGSVKINGHELRDLTEYERSRYIAYTGHQPELISDTISENISLGGTEPVKRYLDMVCLSKDEETFIGNGGVCLSGGQAQRVALARALYQNSKILVLDDPFSALDKETESLILGNLRKYASDKIVIIITHRQYLFPQFDKVIMLKGGQSYED